MKRHGNLFERIAAFDNLELAYRKASRGRSMDRAVLKFRDRLEENLIQMQNELIWGMYTPGKYFVFSVYEPKERLIYAAPFRDRVMHHAVMNILEPLWDGLFISDSFACRKGKGVHAGLDRVTSMLQSAHDMWGGRAFCLQADISKYFPSINHHVLMSIIKRKIKCKRTLDLLDQIVFIEGDRDDVDSHNLPIGNLISQWCANIYLNELDMFVKHELKVTHYARYMDDFILLHHNKAELHRMLELVDAFLANKLCLSLNKKTSIFPVEQGIDLMGFRLWRDHRLLRKSSARRMVSRLRYMRARYAEGKIPMSKVRQRVGSWLAHCSHCNGWRVRRRIMAQAVFSGDRDPTS